MSYVNCNWNKEFPTVDLDVDVEASWNLLKDKIDQGSQTRGTRAACGPRNYFVRPAAMSTNLKIFWIKTTSIIHFTRKKYYAS